MSVLQKAESQYGSFIHVFSFKATHQDLVDFLNQLQLRVSNNQTRLRKIIKVLHQEVPEESADGLKGIFKEGYYMIANEHDAYIVDSIITLSVIQASYYKLNYYMQVLTHLKKSYHQELSSLVEDIIKEEERLLHNIQDIQMQLHKKTITDPVIDNLFH